MIKNALIASLSSLLLIESYFIYELKTSITERAVSMEKLNATYYDEIQFLKEEVKKKILMPEFISHPVQFTSQAPLANWSDPKQAYGCEEASVLMAISWAKNENISPQRAIKEITAISDYQFKEFGNFYDTSLADTYERIVIGYFGYTNSYIQESPTIEKIKRILAEGNLVIAPVNARILGNPNYTPPGPIQHMIVIIGYDDFKKEFITHDPGTNSGANAIYSYEKISLGLQDYETGKNGPLKDSSSIIVISRDKSLAYE